MTYAQTIITNAPQPYSYHPDDTNMVTERFARVVVDLLSANHDDDIYRFDRACDRHGDGRYWMMIVIQSDTAEDVEDTAVYQLARLHSGSYTVLPMPIRQLPAS